MRNVKFRRDQDGQRWAGKFKISFAELIVATGILMLVVGGVLAVTTSSPLALLPGTTFAVGLGLVYIVFRHYRSISPDNATTTKRTTREQAFKMDVHPLLDSGWEDDLSPESAEWVDMTSATFFKVVGTRGICPRGLAEGDFLKVETPGKIAPALCAEAEAVLRMAANNHEDVREWCCPVYDHLLVFKKLDKVS